MQSACPTTTSSLRLVIALCVSGMPTKVPCCTPLQTIMVEGTLTLFIELVRDSSFFRIASIDFKLPYILSGSSDKHLRLVDITTSLGWCTSPDSVTASGVCETCGNAVAPAAPHLSSQRRRAHQDLVRSVALNHEFVVSGSYDFTVKVWDRATGALIADLAGGHSGRIFCVGFDHSKVGTVATFTYQHEILNLLIVLSRSFHAGKIK